MNFAHLFPPCRMDRIFGMITSELKGFPAISRVEQSNPPELMKIDFLASQEGQRGSAIGKSKSGGLTKLPSLLSAILEK
jgi:hypothetical protein